MMRFFRVDMEAWLWGYGLMRHSHDDIVLMVREHVDALDVLLKGKRYVLGEQLTADFDTRGVLIEPRLLLF